MIFPDPEDTVLVSSRALNKVTSDTAGRELRRRELALETGYTMFLPGYF